MCGIAGLLGPVGQDDSRLRALARRLADTLAHRGPDAAGAWVDATAGIAFGHTRLAIIDLSAAGAQPMHSADGRWVVVYNGEIYNHRELRAELARGGHAFRGHSDTEALVEGVAAWGFAATLPRLNGMFALAAWDRLERRLWLARDRLGEKPLYYASAGGAVLFGSELKALAAHPEFDPGIDRGALVQYLRYGCVPAPGCIYAGARKLPPGTLLCLEAGRPLPAPRTWWSMPVPGTAVGIDPDEAIAAAERLLRDSVALRLEADVPVGAFLSGGIDSSLVAALAQVAGSRPVRTFSIGFDIAGYDEAPFARAVARHLGTQHTEVYLDAADALAVIPDLPRIWDEPFADASQIPTALVARIARRDVTVALSGDGGDELFGGYNRHVLGGRIAALNRHVPVALRGVLARLLCAPSPERWDRVLRGIERALPARLRPLPPGERIHKLAACLRAEDAAVLYRQLLTLWQAPEALVAGAAAPPAAGTTFAPGSDVAAAMMYLDTIGYLPDDLLVKLDRASMAVGLEARVPFLDHRLVEFAATLPTALKIRGAAGKWILRQVLARHVPPALFRRPKMGFGVPLDHWLRGPLRDWAEALIDERRLAREGLFVPAPIRAAWREHLSGSRNLQYPLWAVLMFQAWREAWCP